MGTGKGLVGFQGYKGCITGYTLFEEDKIIYKFNYSLHNPTSTQHLDRVWVLISVGVSERGH
jgi:hypothetical protein